MSRWGVIGAAGILLFSNERVLLQLRSRFVDRPLTWSIPGGAIGRGETARTAALREAREECGLSASAIEVIAEHEFRSKSWTYTTFVAECSGALELRRSWEAVEHRWVSVGDVKGLELHPDFEASWPELKELIS